MAYQHQLDATDPTTWPDAGAYPAERLAERAPVSEGAEARSTNDETPDR
jgi:hypothetical protein